MAATTALTARAALPDNSAAQQQMAAAPTGALQALTQTVAQASDIAGQEDIALFARQLPQFRQIGSATIQTHSIILRSMPLGYLRKATAQTMQASLKIIALTAMRWSITIADL
jgi:hypothetical protein